MAFELLTNDIEGVFYEAALFKIGRCAANFGHVTRGGNRQLRCGCFRERLARYSRWSSRRPGKSGPLHRLRSGGLHPIRKYAACVDVVQAHEIYVDNWFQQSVSRAFLNP